MVRDGPTAPAWGEEAPNLVARRPIVERSGRAAQSGNYFGATMLAKASALLGLPDRCRRGDSSTGIPWRLDCGGSGRRRLGDGGRDLLHC